MSPSSSDDEPYSRSLLSGFSSVTSAPSSRLLVTYGSLEYSLHIPTLFYLEASNLLHEYHATLANGTKQSENEDKKPTTQFELLAGFIGHVVEKGELDHHEQTTIRELQSHLLKDFNMHFLGGENIHLVVASLVSGLQKQKTILRSYYKLCAATNNLQQCRGSALFRAVEEDTARLGTIFGGQGNTHDYFQELLDLYSIYPMFVEVLIQSSAEDLEKLSRRPDVKELFPGGLDITTWLKVPESRPSAEYLISAPISFPLIGLIQLANFSVMCQIVGYTPGAMNKFFCGTTGHSQGIITATAIASSSSWESFALAASNALRVLFFIGCRSQQAHPHSELCAKSVQDSFDHGEGRPSYMLGVRNIEESLLRQQVDAANTYLPSNSKLEIGLINGRRNFVVVGLPIYLINLCRALRKIKAPEDLDQNRVPFSKRKPTFTQEFLPITAPYHSQYLTEATKIIMQDVKDLTLCSDELLIPVINTETGEDLRSQSNNNTDLIPRLIRMVTERTVNWPKACMFDRATHLIEFGPGGISGIGSLTQHNKAGLGVQVILAGTLSGQNSDVGYKSNLYSLDEKEIKQPINWQKSFAPKLVRSTAGQIMVDTKFSRLLGLPPIMVAGMTPCTVHCDFVTATMNAGYHIELAGGGYYNGESLATAIRQIHHGVPPGMTITLNVIYADPSSIRWQIPLIAELRKAEIMVSGLTIGAGVPSLDVSNEYIQTLGLRHISFKPGTKTAINQVIEIAKNNQDFPIIMQVTGGRGGGHHSFEDFHEPILHLYGHIRRQKNIILVAGSGFGDAQESYPYLSGTWSTEFGFPIMPFDGILFGSRIMVVREAHTSDGAKKLIIEATGVPSSEWEGTYDRPTGGVLTVRSEMGEPIHKLATRGVQLWAELDRNVFSLDKVNRAAVLKKQKSYIIRRLNYDFQKVWFGQDAAGNSVDLEEMTYIEVLRRLLSLMFIRHETRWIHKSYAIFISDWIRRIEERFSSSTSAQTILSDDDGSGSSILEQPLSIVDDVLQIYPESQYQLVMVEDASYFMSLCKSPGRKPVPFVPALDDDFERWLKKDSLWQSEDLQAVVGQDAGRTCILQGPVAVRHSKVINEPVKHFLDGVNTSYIKALVRDLYDGNEDNIPIAESLSSQTTTEDRESRKEVIFDTINIIERKSEAIYSISSDKTVKLPSQKDWFLALSGTTPSWRQHIFTTDVIVQGKKVQENPFK